MLTRWLSCLLAVSLVIPATAQRPTAPASTSGALERDVKLAAPKSLAQLPAANKRWALVIGVDQYEDPQFTSLRGASNDARILADSFVKYAGFPASQTILLASDQPPERHPTRSNILIRLANLARLVPQDGLLLFAYAGHGMERENQVFLLPSDARASNNVRVLQQTALNVNDIKDWIKEMNVKQVLMLLDACRNDPTASRATGPNLMTDGFKKAFDFDVRNSSVEAFATIYATKVGARAYEYAEKKQGYFTWALAEGLKGAAAGSNGEVTLASLQRFVQDTVPRQVRIDLGEGVDQRPFAEIRGYRAEELVISKVLPAGSQPAAGLGPPSADPRAQELEEYGRISTSRDPAALQGFISRYPTSPLVEQIRHRIATVAWQNIADSKDIKVLKAYMESYPASAYAPLARQTIEMLERDNASKAGVISALDRYARAYQSRDIEQVKAVYPGLSRDEQGKLADFFKMARSISFELRPAGDPQFDGTAAMVIARRVIQFTDQSGKHPEAQGQVRIKLRAGGDGTWVIEIVEPVK